jgi:hypothetical protein
MKQPVTARSVNYEMQLLRAVMSYADCWTDELAARYSPLRQIKRRIGKVASKTQLKTIIATAMAINSGKLQCIAAPWRRVRDAEVERSGIYGWNRFRWNELNSHSFAPCCRVAVEWPRALQGAV